MEKEDYLREKESSAPLYNGVPVDNPLIVQAIRTMIKNGHRNEDICRVVGMPQEVVDKQRALVRNMK
jgi:hypothetical protein